MRPFRAPLAVAVSALSVAVLTWVVTDRPIYDTDYFWHLRTGALIAESGSVPRTDPFSYSAPGARWIDLHWLFQLGLHGLYGLGGHAANRTAGLVLGLLVVAISAATLWRNDRPALSGIALALLVLTAGVRFIVRPDTVSLVLAAAVLALLWRDERRNDRWVLAIVPLQLLWANVHGFQAVGLVLVAIALFAEIAAPWVDATRARRRDRVRRLGGVLALGMLASLANPNGLDGALFPLRQLAMIAPSETLGFGQTIQELRSPLAGFDPQSASSLLAFVVLGVVSFAALVLDRRRVSLFDALVWVSFLGLALSAVRNIALFALAAAPIFALHLGRWLDDGTRIPLARQPALGAVAIAALVLVTGVVTRADVATFTGPRGSRDRALADFWFPERAVDWIDRHRPPGPLYHRLGDGGYLIWRLWPRYRVLIDGRLETYGEKLFAEIELAGGGGPVTFSRLDERYRFGTALLHFDLFRDLSLFAALAASPDWTLVHLDEVAAVFVRAEAASGKFPAVARGSPILFEPLAPGPPHPMDLWRRRQRILLLTIIGRLAEARALLEETRARYDDPTLDQIARMLAQTRGAQP